LVISKIDLMNFCSNKIKKEIMRLIYPCSFLAQIVVDGNCNLYSVSSPFVFRDFGGSPKNRAVNFALTPLPILPPARKYG